MVYGQSYSDHLNKTIRDHEGMVIRIAGKFNVNDDYRDELLQSGRMALYRAYTAYDPNRGVPFAGYAWRCIHNEMTSFVRSLRRFYANIQFGHAVEECPAHEFDRHSEDQAVLSAVESLPSRERSVIEKRFGLSSEKELILKQLAVEMDISHESVRRLELRALNMLRQYFQVNTD